MKFVQLNRPPTPPTSALTRRTPKRPNTWPLGNTRKAANTGRAMSGQDQFGAAMADGGADRQDRGLAAMVEQRQTLGADFALKGLARQQSLGIALGLNADSDRLERGLER